MGFLGGALGVILNPVGKIIDVVGDAVGLPPVVQDGVKVAVGVATGNLILAAEGAVGAVASLSKSAPAETSYVPARQRPQEGYAAPSCAAPDGAASGNLDAKLVPYLEAIKTFEQNLGYLDGVAGKKDGRITRADLGAIEGDTRVSPSLRQAAGFFLDNPGYFTQLETSGKYGLFDWSTPRQDDAFNLKNLGSERRRVESLFAEHGRPEAATPCEPPRSSPPACPPVSRREEGSEFRDIVSNPSLSTEDKIQALLSTMSRETDQEIVGLMENMADARGERAKLGDSQADRSKAATLDSSVEQLNLRLQQLVERRRQMFDLMSNMSSKFNEMAKTAIQNLGRA